MSEREHKPRFGLSISDMQRIISAMLSDDANHRQREAQSLAAFLSPEDRPPMNEAVIEFRDMDEDEWLEAVRRMAASRDDEGVDA